MEAGRVRQIVEQCQRGDREAFGQLYTLMHDRLLRVCQRYVPDETTCEDLLHDAFLLIFSKIDSIKDISKAEAWMQKVTQNLALTYLQQRKQKHEVPLDGIKEAAVSVDMGCNLENIDVAHAGGTCFAFPDRHWQGASHGSLSGIG